MVTLALTPKLHLVSLNVVFSVPSSFQCTHDIHMIETFKILSYIYDSRVTNFPSKSYFSTTRGHNFKLFVQHANLNIRKWFFSIRIVDIWDRLPSNVVNASNVVCFEKRLDKCWADLKVKFDHDALLNYS